MKGISSGQPVRTSIASALLLIGGGLTMQAAYAGAPTVTERVLHTFGTYGAGSPITGLFRAADGSLYGTSHPEGGPGPGTVYKVSPRGKLGLVGTFTPDVGTGAGELMQASDGNFYAVASGGVNAYGAIFRMTPAGQMTVLHVFTAAEGVGGWNRLVEAADGSLYGTSAYGGHGLIGGGSAYKITKNGAFTLLHRFDETTNESQPAGLVLGSDGNFYGALGGNGLAGNGALYRMTPAGKITVLHTFSSTDGAFPQGELIQLAADGNFYGTTMMGGQNNLGTLYRMTPDGQFTTLRSFDVAGGDYPVGRLAAGSDGLLYGVTNGGYDYGFFYPFFQNGTVYRIAADGTGFTHLYSFDAGSDGFSPMVGVTEGSPGYFYGTNIDDTSQTGTLYQLIVKP